MQQDLTHLYILDLVGNAINGRGQVVGQSCDVNNCRAFLWQNGVMTDLNTLVPPGSLYLLTANDINSHGEIVGIALDQSTGEPLAFVAVPCGSDGSVQRYSDAAQTAVGIQIPKVVLPENVRSGLRRQRLGLFR